jgi:hypothetical protein
VRVVSCVRIAASASPGAIWSAGGILAAHSAVERLVANKGNKRRLKNVQLDGLFVSLLSFCSKKE